MRHPFVVAVAVALASTSCQAVAPAAGPANGGPKRPAAGASPARPGDAASSPGGGVALGAVDLLRAPAGGVQAIAGQVFVEARYASALGGASILPAMAGPGVVGMDGARLIGQDGGSLIGQDGGSLVGNSGNTLIGQDGGSLIGQDGGSLVGNSGNTLIGQDGGSLVGNASNTLVAGGRVVASGAGNVVVPAAIAGAGAAFIQQDGGLLGLGAGAAPARPYALAQAPAAPAPAFGDVWPAAGMWVSAVDPFTGLTVPLGLDAAGQPVFAVYTNAHGRFRLFVPAEVAASVRVVARAPGRRDARLVLSASGAGGRLDEDRAMLATYMRYGTANLLLDALAPRAADAPAPEAFQALLAEAYRPAAVELAKLTLDDPRREELGLLMADCVIATLAPERMTLVQGPDDPRDPAGAAALAGRPMLEALGDFVARLRRATVAAVPAGVAPRDHFAAKPYVVSANLRRDPGDRFAVERSADMVDFVVRAHLAQSAQPVVTRAFDILNDLGLPVADRDLLNMAKSAIVAAFLADAGAATASGEATAERLARLVREAGGKLAALPPLPPVTRPAIAVPEPPPPLAVDVGTVAGATDPNGARAAGIQSPWGLAAAPAAVAGGVPVLYTTDRLEHAIWRITFEGADMAKATFTRVAGQAGQAGLVDGPGDVARFTGPRGLAVDAAGRLYVADTGNHAIRRLTFDAGGQATVETVAGGTEGRADGLGREARFNQPMDLVALPGGDLVVTDNHNSDLRRITFTGGAAAVSTYLGQHADARVEGPREKAWSAFPGAIALAPDGAICFSEFGSQAIRRIASPLGPDARTSRLAGGKTVSPRKAVEFWADAHFDVPAGLAVDAAGRVWVTDMGAHEVRVVYPDGWVRTLAGSGKGALTDGAGGPEGPARFGSPAGVAMAADGTAFVADADHRAIRRIRLR